MSIAVAFSNKGSHQAAVKEIVVKIKSQIGGQMDFCLALAGERFPPELITELKLMLNARTFVCGVSSEVIFNGEMSDAGIVLAAFTATESCGYRTYPREERNRLDLEKALRDAAHKKFTGQGMTIGFIPEAFQREDVISAIGAVFGRHFPFAGIYPWKTLPRFLSIYNNEVVSDSLTGGLVLGKELSVAVGSTHGFKPIGLPFRLKKIQGERVFSLDSGEPAYSIYRHYFQEKLKPLEEDEEELRNLFSIYPLGFKTDDGLEYLISVPTKLFVDGSLLVRGELFNDRIVRLMFSTPSLTLESSRNLAAQLKDKVKHIALAFVVESIHRLKVLYPEASREFLSIREELGKEVPVVGLVSDYQVNSIPFEGPHSANVVNSGLSIVLIGNN